MNKKGKRLLRFKNGQTRRVIRGGRFDHRDEGRSHESPVNSTQLPMRNKNSGGMGVQPVGRNLANSTPPSRFIAFAIPYERQTSSVVTHRLLAPSLPASSARPNGAAVPRNPPNVQDQCFPLAVSQHDDSIEAGIARRIAFGETTVLTRHSVEEIRGISLGRLQRNKRQRSNIRFFVSACTVTERLGR
ncbi:MAG: hypothetical protein ACO1RT_19665 [Planctomycetaceae bacterium]